MHPQLELHGSFAHLKLGRNPRRDDPRLLRLAKYLDLAALPPVPETYDLAAAVAVFPMYDNDTLGDCTCAAAGHMIQAWSAEVGSEETVPDGAIDLLYWETGSPAASTGTAGGPTDDGREEAQILNYWRKTGVGTAAAGRVDQIGAYAAVDPADHALVQAAIYLFGGVYIGVSLPLTAQGQTVWDVVGDGQTGDSAPGSWGGHAVPYLAYTPAGVTVVTWGSTLDATWAFNDAYVDEVYAIISPDALAASGVTLQGFDVEQLTADLAAL